MSHRPARLTTSGTTWVRHLRARWVALQSAAESGMSTAEYAVGTVAAVAFAAVLIAVVKSSAVSAALTRIITGALTVGG